MTFLFYTLKDRIICNKVIHFYARQFSWLKGECYDSVGKSAKLQSIPNGEKSSGFRQVNDITWLKQYVSLKIYSINENIIFIDSSLVDKIHSYVKNVTHHSFTRFFILNTFTRSWCKISDLPYDVCTCKQKAKKLRVTFALNLIQLCQVFLIIWNACVSTVLLRPYKTPLPDIKPLNEYLISSSNSGIRQPSRTCILPISRYHCM